MKAVIFTSTLIATGVLSWGLSYAVTSADIEGAATEKNSSLETFSVEIRGPGGKRIESDVTPVKRPVISYERLGIKPKAKTSPSSQGSNTESVNKVSFLGFFDYKFPEGYNISDNAGTVDLKSGETLWNLALRTKIKDSSVSVNQQAAAIYRRNLSCFPNGRLFARSGCIVTLPTPEQSRMEDLKLARNLISHNGVPLEEYRYALAHCSSGICGIPSPEVKKAASGSGTTNPSSKVNEKISLSTSSENGGTGVIYYTPEKTKPAEKKNEGKEIQAQESFVLLDDRGRQLTLDQVAKLEKKDTLPGEGRASGATLTFSMDDGTVKALNAKGEIISEVSQKYDGMLQDMRDQVSGNSNELMAARSENAELKQQIGEVKQELSELKELLKQQKKEQGETKSENEFSTTPVVITSVLSLLFILGLLYLIYLKRNKYRKEIEDETAEDLEDDGDFDHLMTLDTISMPSGVNEKVDLNESDDFSSQPSQNASKSAGEKKEFVVADDTSPDVSVDTIPESSVEKVEPGAQDVVTEDPSLRTSEKVDIKDSEDLVPKDIVSDEPLDESAFLDENLNQASSNQIGSDEDEELGKEADDILSSLTNVKNGSAGIDLEKGSLDDKDIDNILAQSQSAETSGAETVNEASSQNEGASQNEIPEATPVETQSPEPEFTSPAGAADIDITPENSDENASVDDIDALLAAAQQDNKPVANDDIDDLLKNNQSEVADLDDIDALIATSQSSTAESLAGTEVTSNEDFSSPYDDYPPEEKEKIIKEQEEDLGLARAYININSKSEARDILENLQNTAATKDIRDRARDILRTLKS